MGDGNPFREPLQPLVGQLAELLQHLTRLRDAAQACSRPGAAAMPSRGEWETFVRAFKLASVAQVRFVDTMIEASVFITISRVAAGEASPEELAEALKLWGVPRPEEDAELGNTVETAGPAFEDDEGGDHGPS